MRVGVSLYGLATVAFGVLDLVWGAFEPSHQPIQALGHIPGEPVLASIAGLWMVAAGLAMLWRRTARMGGSRIRHHLPSLFPALAASVP